MNFRGGVKRAPLPRGHLTPLSPGTVDLWSRFEGLRPGRSGEVPSGSLPGGNRVPRDGPASRRRAAPPSAQFQQDSTDHFGQDPEEKTEIIKYRFCFRKIGKIYFRRNGILTSDLDRCLIIFGRLLLLKIYETAKKW